MAKLQEQLTKAKKLQPSNLQDDLFKFIKSIEKELIEKEKQRLSKDSEDIFGNPIGFYSPATEIISNGEKKAGDPFTAFDSGDFFKGFHMKEVSEVLIFGSTDSKTLEILSSNNYLYDELFGLSDKDLKEVITEMLLFFFLEKNRSILDL